MKRFRAAAVLEGQPAAHAARLALAAFEASLMLADDREKAEARAAAAEVERYITAARATGRDASWLASVERDFARIRAKSGV